MRPAGRRWLVWVLVWAAVAGLLYFAMRQVPLRQVAQTLQHLTPLQIGALLTLNLVYLAVINLRWWLILRSLGHRLPLFVMGAYRLAGFGLSYVTPGPQFGGEPLQVHLLRARHAIALPDAVTSVFLDRLFDLLVNFTFLVFGCAVILVTGLGGGRLADEALLVPLLLFLLPAGHVLALWRGWRPVTTGLSIAARRLPWPVLRRAVEIARASETQIAQMLRQQFLQMLVLLGISLVGWVLAVWEYSLTLRFLGVQASFAETISAMTAARVAFLLPLPAGLGALEASQVIAAQALGWGAGLGAAVSLVIRARDSLFALLGLAIGSWAASPERGAKAQPEEGSS